MEIVKDPYETLYQTATPVTEDEFSDVVETANRALKLLKKHRGGIGLAANQVGHTKRWFVSQLFKIVINPVVLDSSDAVEEAQEGCLSKPGQEYKVSRPSSIKVQWLSKKGTLINRKLAGLEAKVFLHELDHLNGINIWNK